jgi:hypothetical protein
MNEANKQMDSQLQGRLVGVVQLRVAGRLYAVPVQAMDFASSDGNTEHSGGFFVQGDTMGIVVDETATEEQMRSQVMEGCAEAARHLQTKFLN